jgi:Eukaryotic initiation factor 4E
LNGSIRAFKDRFIESSLPKLIFNKNRKSFQPEQLDIYWENLVLALIGETIDEGDEICGCRVVDKSAKKGKSASFFFVSSNYSCLHRLLSYPHPIIRRSTHDVQVRIVAQVSKSRNSGEDESPHARCTL